MYGRPTQYESMGESRQDQVIAATRQSPFLERARNFWGSEKVKISLIVAACGVILSGIARVIYIAGTVTNPHIAVPAIVLLALGAFVFRKKLLKSLEEEDTREGP